jgi:CTP synthase (UTP-ammonia lyase)
MQAIRVALVGDRSETVLAHMAIPPSPELAGAHLHRTVCWDWVVTASINPASVKLLEGFDCVWCVPGSPYVSEAGALEGIRFARDSTMPFLGTCGGCQHAILEYARNELGIRDAEHAETHPDALPPLIAPLSCALVGARGTVVLDDESMIRGIYGRNTIEEGYHCGSGLNPGLEHLLSGSPLSITGRDENREARALELGGRQFFLLTQFQPDRSALTGILPPIVAAFVAAAGRPAKKGQGGHRHEDL